MKTSFNERFHGSLYLMLQLLRNRPVGPFIRRLQAWERLDRPAFEHLTRERLLETLRYARERVPLYSSGAWREAFSRSTPDDLLSWPMLERDTVRTRRAELLTIGDRQIPGLLYRNSSASTGKPLQVALNPHAAAWSWANEYRAMLWYGVPIGAKTLMLWGYTNTILDWVRNRKTLVTTSFTPSRVEEAARYLIQQRPKICWGLPSAITQLAQYVRAAYPGAPQPLVSYVRLGGEQVYPFQREEITKHLGARVIETYGCTEVGAIAQECPMGSLHIFAEHVHLEILRDGEPAALGEFGDIVVTSLTNKAMPLIRCRIGDRGILSPEPCPCSLPHPVLSSLEGRAADLFLAADGSKIHGSTLGHALQSFFAKVPLGVVQLVLFQQVDQWNWKVLVESRDGFNEVLASQLTDIVRSVYGKDCNIKIERVPMIPREASGKFRYYRPIRNLKPAAGQAESLSEDVALSKRCSLYSKFRLHNSRLNDPEKENSTLTS